MMSASMNVRQYFLTMVNHLPKHQSLTSQFMVSNNPNRGSIPLISYSHSCRNQSKGLNKVLPTYLEKNPPISEIHLSGIFLKVLMTAST